MKIRLAVLFLLTGLFIESVAQTNHPVDSVSLLQLIEKVESNFNYKFYFNKSWMDEEYVSSSFLSIDHKVSFGDYLDAVFAQTSLTYYMTGNEILILNGQTLITELNLKEQSQKAVVAEVFQFPANEAEDTDAEKKVTFGSKKSVTGEDVILTGYVADFYDQSSLFGVSVVADDRTYGTITDENGFYRLVLSPGTQNIYYNFVGMQEVQRIVTIYENAQLDIALKEKVTSLNEVVIQADYDAVNDNQTGFNSLKIESIKKLPSLGEADVMRMSLSLPGVQSVGEGSSGFNVRGGATSQNLILMNGITIYNPSHLFGFFSVFNSDVIKEANLYKSGIDPTYGGRISSVFDVRLRNGNRKKFQVKGGISPMTTRLSVEGPIKKDTTSFLLGYRTTYSDWIYSFFENSSFRNNIASFQDVIGRVDHRINESNNINVQGYFSTDVFNLATDTSFGYINAGASMEWGRIINESTTFNLTSSWSSFDYRIRDDINEENAFNLGYSINQFDSKAEISRVLSERKTLSYGLQGLFYHLNPGSIEPLGDLSVTKRSKLEKENGLELAAFANLIYDLTNKFSFTTGLRLSGYTFFGPNTIFDYATEDPTPDTETDSTSYGSFSPVKTYFGPELRLSSRYLVNDNLSLKFSYDLTRQSIHMLSNTAAVSPTDTWRLSDPYLKPQIGSQISLGLYQDIKKGFYSFSVEGYYKKIHRTVVLKDFADIKLNDQLETEISNGNGRSYGVEFFLNKVKGKATGWISYTYSRTLLQSNVVNGGKEYAASYDIPHSFNFVFTYLLSRRFSFSSNCTYRTGRPYSSPTARFIFDGDEFTYYSDRNTNRIPDYFRLDLSLNMEGNHKLKKLAHSSWSFSIYNVTGRDNVFSVFFESEEGKIAAYKLSIFNRMIPTVSYNFRI